MVAQGSSVGAHNELITKLKRESWGDVLYGFLVNQNIMWEAANKSLSGVLRIANEEMQVQVTTQVCSKEGRVMDLQRQKATKGVKSCN